MRAEEFVTEKKWSGKYKGSINCSHPKGFSQKAHCAGRKKSNESVAEAVCPDCGLCESHGSGDVQLQEACWKGYHRDGSKKMFGKTYPNCVKNKTKNESSLTEFAPVAGDYDGNNGFNDEKLKMLAAKWYNGDEDPRVESTLAAIGWEIGQDEGYDDEPGVFVVRAGDVDGKSYISWPADELRQSVAEGSDDTVRFDVDSENAYNHVMDQFGAVIDWDGDTMVAPRQYWGAIQELALAAGGEASEEQGVAEGSPQPGQPLVDAILKVMPISQEIWFHGSRATGKHRRNSDTDILVVVADDLVGDQYLAVVRILQKLSSHFDNYDIQPTKAGNNIHRIAQEEGQLLWSNKPKQGVAEGSLNEFAPGGDDEDGDEDPYRYPKPTRYRRSADYFNQFEADHFDREDFDDATGVFKGYQDGKHIAHFKFDDPAQTGGDDSGQGWYYEPKYNNSSGNNNTAAPAAGDSAQREQQELDMIDAFLKSGNRPSPGSQIYNLMKRHGVSEGARVARKPGQPADSKKHSDLYTDENPRGTITGLKFATAEDARASVTKIRSSGRSHAHKIQAAVAMEQRARAAGKADAAAVYRRYINANKKTESLEQVLQVLKEDLRKWFKQKWVRFGPDGKIRGACARGSESEGKPKCLPQAKAHALGKKGRAKAGARKRRQDPDANRSGKAINVKTK